jgi:hypothetical protein
MSSPSVLLNSEFRSNSDADSSASEFRLVHPRHQPVRNIELKRFCTRNKIYNCPAGTVLKVGGALTQYDIQPGFYYGDELVTELNRMLTLIVAGTRFSWHEPGGFFTAVTVLGENLAFDGGLEFMNFPNNVAAAAATTIGGCADVSTTRNVGIRLFLNDTFVGGRTQTQLSTTVSLPMTFVIPFATERDEIVLFEGLNPPVHALHDPISDIGKIGVELWDLKTGDLLDNNNAEYAMEISFF